MNTIQIENLLTRDKFTRNEFLGVFARDELPYIKRYPSCFVFNTDERSEPGQHWLAVYYDENRNAEFFDSLAFHPSHYSLVKYLNHTSTNWTNSNKRIQGYQSHLCGVYCVFFLYQRCRGMNIKDFEKLFDNYNDNFILNLIKNI